jgi:methyl-accepting chemotaxis protein-like sensor
MVMIMRAVSAADLARQITEMVEQVFAGVDALRQQVERLYARHAAVGTTPTTGDLSELRPDILANLGGARGLVTGSGYIPAPAAVADGKPWLEWWIRERDGRPSRLVVDLDPASEAFRDYTKQPWFNVPVHTGARHITGPYIDYVCGEEYTLTFTLPVRYNGDIVGVAGSDVIVSGFEAALIPALRALGTPTAIVNMDGRVIVSNTVRQVAGSLIREPDVTALWQSPTQSMLYHCGDEPIGVLVLQT